MIITTYNANSIRSRLETLIPWIKTNQPDVLCIQETKVQDHEFPIDPLLAAGYNVVFRGEKKYNGVAILSRQIMENPVVVLEGDSLDQTRFLQVSIGDLHIINTYVPQGNSIDSEKFQYKLKWLELLKKHIEKNFTPKDKLIWTGDMNVARQDIDVHDPDSKRDHVCFCETVKEALENVIGWGFSDVFRKIHPQPEQYTFWDYRVPDAVDRKMGWRLDYIFASDAVANQCKSCKIDIEARKQEKPSDHTFLTAEFALNS